MHGATWTPAGSTRASRRSGAASLRGATVSTGRMPQRLLTTASIHARRRRRAGAAATSGARARRSTAQASEPAVVSWPAARSVTRWSRSSSSSQPAARSPARTSSPPELAALGRDERAGAPRRPPGARRNAPHGLRGPRSRWDEATSRRPRQRGARRRASRGCPPPARRRGRRRRARRMTSSVSACSSPSSATGRPRGQAPTCSLGDLAHERRGGGDPLAVEGPEHEPADAQVRVPVGEEDRARAGDERERPRARAAARDPRIGRVDRAHRVGMPDEHERRVVEGQADRERLAVAGRAAAQERRRPRHPLERLQGGRLARARRQGGVHRPADGSARAPVPRAPQPRPGRGPSAARVPRRPRVARLGRYEGPAPSVQTPRSSTRWPPGRRATRAATSPHAGQRRTVAAPV